MKLQILQKKKAKQIDKSYIVECPNHMKSLEKLKDGGLCIK